MKDHVRMKLNRNLHAQFKRVSGKTNNERMSKLLTDSNEKYELIGESINKTIMIKYWKRTSQSKDKTCKTLASALAVSITTSVTCVAYVCVVNGWLS